MYSSYAYESIIVRRNVKHRTFIQAYVSGGSFQSDEKRCISQKRPKIRIVRVICGVGYIPVSIIVGIVPLIRDIVR